MNMNTMDFKIAELLAGLNDAQREAALTIDGRYLVLAGAGSGKTSTLTVRIGNMISKGVDPGSIFCATFTNKAAGEMKERLEAIIGSDKMSQVWMGTFHSLCVRILRKHGHLLGYKYNDGRTNFMIYDTGDVKEVIETIYKQMNIYEKFKPGVAIAYIDNAKNNLWSSEYCLYHNAETNIDQIMAQVYAHYERLMLEYNAMDFGDLIMNTVRILNEFPDEAMEWQSKFQYVLSDEFQDVNPAQFALLKLLAAPQMNIFVVGDHDQCWHEDSLVFTKDGEKKIKDIKAGDFVATMKNGSRVFSEVTHITPEMKKDTVKITTKLGKEIKVTYDHKMFATKPDFKDKHYYLYLMYREDKGYRLGILTGGIQGAIHSRTHSEKSDRLWLLERYKEETEASYMESYLSLKYKVPTSPYFHNGRAIRMNQESLDSLFDSFGSNGYKILSDYRYSFDHPHHIPRGVTKDRVTRKNVSLVMNAPKGGNQINYESNGKRVRRWISNYKKARAFAEELYEEEDANIIYEKYHFQERTYLDVLPACQLLPGMKIPLVIDDEHVLDTVVSIEDYEVMSPVYHLEVEDTGILIADDIVSHNSIYKFRGSDIGIIMNFEQHFSPCQILKLEMNYRSSNNVVEAGNSLISNNRSPYDKVLRANKGDGEKVKIVQLDNEYTEAAFVATTIKNLVKSGKRDWKDFAILYRGSHQAIVFEKLFTHNFIPYTIVGGTSFMEREEIKDISSYLRVISNRRDDVALKRIINKPTRGIGKTTIDAIEKYSIDFNVSFYRALKAVDDIAEVKKAPAGKVKAFLSTLDHFEEKLKSNMTLREFVQYVLEQTGLKSLYRKRAEKDQEEEERLENLEEYLNLVAQFEKDHPEHSLEDFIQEMSLIRDVKAEEEDENEPNLVKLMTMHASKGLEFPVVFGIGFNEKIFPSWRSLTPEDIEEERRIAYVAITRAEEVLYLTYVKQRSSPNGRGVQSYDPSRFLVELDENLVEFMDLS